MRDLVISKTASGSSVDVWNVSDSCSCGHATGAPSQAYNEEAFRYFLEIERRRSERSNRPFLLVLVDLAKSSGTKSHFSQTMATWLFSRLTQCLRETDFVGWYRENNVAGAVLTERAHNTPMDVRQRVAERVRQALNEWFESDVSGRLRVSVFEFHPNQEHDFPVREGYGQW
jgi:GGDEF domain-containing protein